MKKAFLMTWLALLISSFVFTGYVPLAAGQDVIKIGVQADASGPCASCGAKQLEGFVDYVKYQNEVLGGIKGITVKGYADDMKYQIPLSMDVSLYSSELRSITTACRQSGEPGGHLCEPRSIALAYEI